MPPVSVSIRLSSIIVGVTPSVSVVIIAATLVPVIIIILVIVVIGARWDLGAVVWPIVWPNGTVSGLKPVVVVTPIPSTVSTTMPVTTILLILVGFPLVPPVICFAALRDATRISIPPVVPI